MQKEYDKGAFFSQIAIFLDESKHKSMLRPLFCPFLHPDVSDTDTRVSTP